MKLITITGPSGARKAEADGDGIIHLCHLLLVQMTHVLPQPAFVNRTNLLQQNDGILAQAHAAPRDVDVGGQLCLAGLAGDGGGNHCG